jgi:hypothetical protein
MFSEELISSASWALERAQIFSQQLSSCYEKGSFRFSNAHFEVSHSSAWSSGFACIFEAPAVLWGSAGGQLVPSVLVEELAEELVFRRLLLIANQPNLFTRL